MTPGQSASSGNEAIRRQMDVFVSAFQTKDVGLMMSLFSDDMVSYDIIPPLQYFGSDVYRKVWQETFDLFRDPIQIELADLTIRSDRVMAFSHCFVHVCATTAEGQKIDYWERLTCCFQKENDKWLIVHEHVSLPANLKNGKAVMDLKPQ